MSNLLPSDYTLDEAFGAKISSAPKSIRKQVLKELALSEYSRCADDPLYWLDTTQHPAFVYCNTIDKRPFYQCKHCVASNHVLAEASIPQFRIETHLSHWHGITIPESESPLDHFNSIPRKRPFTVKPYMPPMIHYWRKEQFFAVEKSRDMIATWTMIALIFWDVWFHPGTEWVAQSEDATKTYELISRADFIYQNQPKFLRDLHSIKFTKGDKRAGLIDVPSTRSQLIGAAQGPDQVRYLHPAGVFMDEAAFQDKAKDAVGAIQPAIKAGGKLNMISTANPGYFQLICEDRLDDAI